MKVKMLSSVLVVLLFLSTISEGASCSSNFTVPLNEDNPTSYEFCIYKQGQVEYTCRYWNDAAFTGIDINGTDSSQFPEIPCNSSVEGNTLKRTCYLDISIASNSNFSCVIKDTISPDPPTGFCSPPRPPENGFISETLFGSPKTPYLDMVTFGCQEGYHIDGPTNLTCGKNGQYSSDLTVCTQDEINNGSTVVVVVIAVCVLVLVLVLTLGLIVGLIILWIKKCKKRLVNLDNTTTSGSIDQSLSRPIQAEDESGPSHLSEMTGTQTGTRMRRFGVGNDLSRNISDTFHQGPDQVELRQPTTAFSNELGPSSATIQGNDVSEVNTPAETVVITESDKSGPSSAIIQSQQESMGGHSCSTPNAGTRVPLSNGRGKSTSFVLLENPASINDNGDVSLNMDIVARHSQDLYPLSDNLAFSKDSEDQPESHDSRMEEYVVPEAAYSVAELVKEKESTNSGPIPDSTTTEHQYSEIGGSINKEGIHYAHVSPKPKPEGLPDQPVDPTAVVYSEVKKEKLAPKSEESEQPPQTKSAPPTPPPPPSAESLLSIIHPVAGKWEEFGKALEIDEDRLDDFSNEAHDQVRLHDMVHYYFSNVHVKHTWEEFVQALRKIGEYECADRIVREKKLEAHPVTVHPPNANGDPPAVVPMEPIHVHVEDLGSGYPAKTQHKPNDEAVQMPVHVHKLDSAEVTVHPPNANGEPPTTVDNVPTEPIHVGSANPVKHKPNDEAVVPVHMCTTDSMSADKPDVEEQHHPIEPGGVIPASLSPLLPIPDNHM